MPTLIACGEPLATSLCLCVFYVCRVGIVIKTNDHSKKLYCVSRLNAGKQDVCCFPAFNRHFVHPENYCNSL